LGNQLKEQLVEAGFVDTMKKKHIPPPPTPTCNKCGAPIIFKSPKEGDPKKPFEPNGEQIHWELCPFNTLRQKKSSYDILRKLLVYMSVKHGDKFEEAGLDAFSIKVVTAILEKELKPKALQGGKKRKKKKPAEEPLADLELAEDEISAVETAVEEPATVPEIQIPEVAPAPNG